MSYNAAMMISKTIEAYLKEGSWIRRLFEEGLKMAKEGKGPVYDFSLGNPELSPPAALSEALIHAASDPTPGKHRYMPNAGYTETRSAAAKSLSRDHDMEFSAEEILMTVGAAGALNVALKAILDPGDEVICIAPYFVEYRFYIENHAGRMIVANSRDDFDIDVKAISRLLSPSTRAVIINNPNNPTGKVYPQETLNRLGDVLGRASKAYSRPIYLIDDAPYRKLVYDTDRCSSAFAAYENTLMGTSHSKDLGIPGERIGFLAVSPRCEGKKEFMNAAAFANRVLGFVNAPALMQRVVAKVQDEIIDLDWYRKKRDRLVSALSSYGYEIQSPGGAFYLFPKAPGGDDIAFIDTLKSMRVLAVPGTGFGAPGYFRIAYCVNDAVIEGALPAFETAARQMLG
jgi:aspartate aminotransferase